MAWGMVLRNLLWHRYQLRCDHHQERSPNRTRYHRAASPCRL